MGEAGRFPNVSTLWGRVLVDELARSGLRVAVISPGSRSAPLAFAFAAHPDVEDVSVIDERSAAFFALGVARASGRPAAVVTTSGTAAGNLLPAVMEADRAGVPLLVLTADRPATLRDAGDSQAADQIGLFGSRVRWFHQAAEPAADEAALRYLRSTAAHAWAAVSGGGSAPGPVHLNLPFAKPLDPTPVSGDGAGALPAAFDPTALGAAGRLGGAPWRRRALGVVEPSARAVEALAAALAAARRPLLYAGAAAAPPGGDARLREAIAHLRRRLAVPLWAEATSGLRLGAPAVQGQAPADAVVAPELALASPRFAAWARPDLLIRLGEAPVGWAGRRFVAALAGDPAVVQVAVDPWGRRRDPEHAVGWTVAADPARLCERLAERLEAHPPRPGVDEGWAEGHREAARAAREALGREAGGVADLFDGGAFWHLAEVLPEDTALVVSSSMPLRELECFLPATGEPVDVFANRGLNGIDGVTSTALGVAAARRAGSASGGSRTLLVTGDVAFVHDLSGALAAGRLGADLTIVVVDNAGGAIFEHLPAAGFEPGFSRHLLTPPGARLAEVCRGLGLDTVVVDDWGGYREAVAAGLAAGGPRVVLLRTERERNREIRGAILARVGEAVDEAMAKGPHPGPSTSLGTTTLPPQRPSTSRGTTGTPPPGPSTSLGTTVPPCRPEGAERVEGPGRGGAEAAPLVLLHGFTGSAASWGDLRRRLAAAEPVREVVALDLPGHGAAPAPGPDAGVEAAAQGVIAELDRRGVSRVHLAGYSLGGRVALAAALALGRTDPDRLASLALLSASPGIADEAERAARRAADDELALAIEADGLAAFVDRWMSHPLFAGQERLGRRHLRVMRDERLAGSAAGFAASLRAMGQGRQPSFWEHLSAIAAPVLLVVGEEDESYVDIARRMAARLPAARLEIVPGAGHAVHLEAADAVARAVLEHSWF